MIIRARHNFLIYPFFKWYARKSIKKHFGVIDINGQFCDKNLPVLLISNHLSWWDGFWAEFVNQKIFDRKFHFMMLEKQLQKHWYFMYAGGYSVKNGTKSIIETLRYTNHLLLSPKNLVLIFPQGKIQSMHETQINFESGIENILKHQHSAIQVVFMVNIIDYFSNQKPGIYIYLQEFNCIETKNLSIQENYNNFYIESIEKHKKTTVNR